MHFGPMKNNLKEGAGIIVVRESGGGGGELTQALVAANKEKIYRSLREVALAQSPPWRMRAVIAERRQALSKST